MLPTLNEGCSNAVVEAMACGLPIISSNREFNDDILNESYAIRIDPQNIQEISNAIQKLVDDSSCRARMSEEALNKAAELTLDVRAQKIIDFMEKRIEG